MVTNRNIGSSLKSTLFIIRRFSLPLIIISLIITGISAYLIIQETSKPVFTKNQIPIAKYTHHGKYDYLAELSTNTFYNDKKVLRTDEGILFKNIIENLTLTYDYSLVGDTEYISHRENIDVSIILEAEEKFVKELSDNEIDYLFDIEKGDSIKIDLKLERIERYFNLLSEETSISKSNYKFKIETNVDVLTSYYGEEIDETIKQTLIVDLHPSTQDGDIILLDGVEHMESKEISGEEIIRNSMNTGLISAAGIMYVISAILFGIFNIVHLKITNIKTITSAPDKLIDKHKDILVYSTEYPSNDRLQQIEVSNFDDLIKLSEVTFKPILYTKQVDEIIFYVLEDTNIYYNTTSMENQTN